LGHQWDAALHELWIAPWTSMKFDDAAFAVDNSVAVLVARAPSR
jgi:hypothetical protein